MPLIFKGRSADDLYGAGLAANTTIFSLRRGSDSHYWNGTNWDATTARWLATTHLVTTGSNEVTWESNVTMPTWVDGTYYARAKAVDKAGNILDQEIGFYYDNTPPDAPGLPSRDGDTVSWPAVPGAVRYKVTIQSDPYVFYVVGTSFSVAAIQDAAVAVVGPGVHEVSVQAEDSAGNRSPASAVMSILLGPEDTEVVTVRSEFGEGFGGVSVTHPVVIRWQSKIKPETLRVAISPSVAHAYELSDNRKALTLRPAPAFAYDTTYTLTITGFALDNEGVTVSANTTYIFKTTKEKTDAEYKNELVVEGAQDGGVKKTGDYVDNLVKLKIPAGFDKYRIVVDGEVVAEGTVGAGGEEVSLNLDAGKRNIEIFGEVEGKTIKKELEVNVSSDTAELQMIGNVLVATPVITSVQSATIAYTLNKATSIMIYVVGSTGQPIWTKKIAEGENGGGAGYNTVTFAAQADDNTLPANGIYVGQVVDGKGNMLNRFHMVIYR